MLQRVMLATQSLTRVKVELIWQSKIMRDWRRVRHFITMFFCLCLALFIFFVWSNFCCWIGRFNWYWIVCLYLYYSFFSFPLFLFSSFLSPPNRNCGHCKTLWTSAYCQLLRRWLRKMVPWKKWYDSTGSKFVGRERQCTCPCIDWGSTTPCKSCKSNKERERNKLLKKCKMKDECSRGNQKVKEQQQVTSSDREATEKASTT